MERVGRGLPALPGAVRRTLGEASRLETSAIRGALSARESVEAS